MNPIQWPTCKSFEDILNPLSLDTFFQEYWEQKPLYLARQRPDYYADLVRLEDLDYLIASTNLGSQSILLGRETANDSTHQFITQPLSMWSTLYNRYTSGHTVGVFCIEHQIPHLSNFFKSLEATLGCVVSGSVYASPLAEVTGFSAHADTDDVYVLQLEGVKHWSLWSAQYPFPQDHIKADEAKLGTPLLEVDLMPGDLLYIPRGVIHKAVSISGPTFHFSLTPDAVLWSDLLLEAFSLAVQEDSTFRQSLPRGLFTLDETKLEREFGALMQRLIRQIRYQPALRKLRSNILARITPPQSGHFQQLQQLASLHADTLLCQRSPGLCQITVDGLNAQVFLHFPSNAVAAPLALEPLLRSITEQNWFTARSLPTSLPLQTKLEVIRNLVREGFLRQASATEQAQHKLLVENEANENSCSSLGSISTHGRDAFATF